MSKFSGKADLYDHIAIHGGFDAIKGTNIYVGKKKLEYNSLKDLISYYPYVIASAGITNGDPEHSTIYLTEKSWVDIEEEEYGHMDTHDYYRKLLQEEIEKHKND